MGKSLIYILIVLIVAIAVSLFFVYPRDSNYEASDQITISKNETNSSTNDIVSLSRESVEQNYQKYLDTLNIMFGSYDGKCQGEYYEISMKNYSGKVPSLMNLQEKCENEPLYDTIDLSYFTEIGMNKNVDSLYLSNDGSVVYAVVHSQRNFENIILYQDENTEPFGLYVSSDKGATWDRIASINDINSSYGEMRITYFGICPQQPETIYLGIAAQAGGGSLEIISEFFISSDGGDNWERIDDSEFQNTSTDIFFINGSNCTNIFIYSAEGDFWKYSTESGQKMTCKLNYLSCSDGI